MRKTAIILGLLCALLILLSWAIGMCGVARYAESRPAPTRTPTGTPWPTMLPSPTWPTATPKPPTPGPTPYPPPLPTFQVGWYPMLPEIRKGE